MSRSSFSRSTVVLGATLLPLLALGACKTAPPTTAPAPRPANAPRPGGNVAPGAPGQAPAGAPGAQQPGDSSRPQFPGAGTDPQPRPYNRVVTPNAVTRDGLFKTHRIGSRILFEIPKGALYKDLLLVARAARVPVNAGYGGQQVGPRRVVRWERRDNRVFLRNVSFETVADSTTPIAGAVRNSNFDLILAAFNVDAYGPDSSAVIDVTRLYTAPPAEIGTGAQCLGAPDAASSVIEEVQSFPAKVAG